MERWKYAGFVFCAAVREVRLGGIVTAGVDVRGEVSVQLFSSYRFRKQHKNGMSLFLTQCSSATHSEMSG